MEINFLCGFYIYIVYIYNLQILKLILRFLKSTIA